MIVKKLSDVKGGGFPGAKYNEDKVAAGVAELMLMANVSERLRHTVETMHRFGLDAASEVERYLKERSKTYGNTNTDRFQFHVSASVEGRTMTPQELTGVARELMKGIGYDKQPYFVYAHHLQAMSYYDKYTFIVLWKKIHVSFYILLKLAHIQR
ncbi:MAG: hypothetical protein K2L45_00525 [Muribaculaceae bacterium]|nr:hypothetical protein [Muribaculaceae bacterium]